MDNSLEIQLDLNKPIKTSFDETESTIRNLITKFRNGEYVSPENIKKANILYAKAKETREKLIKAFATITSRTRHGNRNYNEMYISNPKRVVWAFACRDG